MNVLQDEFVGEVVALSEVQEASRLLRNSLWMLGMSLMGIMSWRFVGDPLLAAAFVGIQLDGSNHSTYHAIYHLVMYFAH